MQCASLLLCARYPFGVVPSLFGLSLFWSLLPTRCQPHSQPIPPLARTCAASSCLSATPHRGARRQTSRANPYAHQASAAASHSATPDAHHHADLPFYFDSIVAVVCSANHGCQTIPPSCRGFPLLCERLPHPYVSVGILDAR